jgi:hypothetical protein
MSISEHITVGIRIKPPENDEMSKHNFLTLTNNHIAIANKNKMRHFDLPNVFDRGATQQ